MKYIVGALETKRIGDTVLSIRKDHKSKFLSRRSNPFEYDFTPVADFSATKAASVGFYEMNKIALIIWIG